MAAAAAVLVVVAADVATEVFRGNRPWPPKACLRSCPLLKGAAPLRRYGAAKTGGAEVVAPAPVLRDTFPNVEELRIELQFDHESELVPSSQVRILHPPARLSLRYACPFPGCTGSFDLEGPVTDLLKDSATSFASDARCAGVRPRRGNADMACTGHMNFRVTARYRRARR